MRSLDGQVAVVTGASRGIGAAIARNLAASGAIVVAAARTLSTMPHQVGSLQVTVQAIRAAGGRVHPVQANLADAADRERLISTTLADHGQIDILVNNAAVTYLAPIESITNKQLRLMMELQVFAPYHLTQLALPQMYERGSGCVLNISSHAAEHPQGPPFEEIQQRGFSVYGMAKAAIERFTTALAAEGYHRGVRANSLAPTDNVATPGAGGHNLIDGFPLEDESVMAEAALVLVVSDFTGRLVHSQQILREIDQSDRPSPSVRPHPNKS